MCSKQLDTEPDEARRAAFDGLDGARFGLTVEGATVQYVVRHPSDTLAMDRELDERSSAANGKRGEATLTPALALRRAQPRSARAAR